MVLESASAESNWEKVVMSLTRLVLVMISSSSSAMGSHKMSFFLPPG